LNQAQQNSESTNVYFIKGSWASQWTYSQLNFIYYYLISTVKFCSFVNEGYDYYSIKCFLSI